MTSMEAKAGHPVLYLLASAALGGVSCVDATVDSHMNTAAEVRAG